MKKKFSKSMITALLLLAGLFSRSSIVTAKRLPPQGDKNQIKVKRSSAPQEKIKKQLSKSRLKKLVTGTIILLSFAGILLVYWLLSKMHFFKQKGNPNSDLPTQQPKKNLNEEDQDDAIQGSSREKNQDQEAEVISPVSEGVEKNPNLDKKGNLSADHSETKEERQQREESVKKLQEKFRQEGRRIGQNFPYLFSHDQTFEYDEEIYYQHDVSPDGRCFAYTGWLAYLHMLNQCEEAYNDLPDLVNKLSIAAKEMATTYGAWRTNLKRVVEDLKDNKKKKAYIITYRSMISYYKKRLESIKVDVSLVSSLISYTAPYEKDYKKAQEWYDLLMQSKQKKYIVKAFNLMKAPWCDHIRWFPQMDQLLGLAPEEWLQQMRLISEEIEKKLHKNEETATQYITTYVVQPYLERIERIINCSQELTSLLPLLKKILAEAQQYKSSLEKQLLWLQKNPNKLALMLRFIRVLTFVLADSNKPHQRTPLSLGRTFGEELEATTEGGVGYFGHLGLHEGDRKKVPTIQDFTYAIHYKKGEKVIPIKGLITIKNDLHAYYAVAKRIWTGETS